MLEMGRIRIEYGAKKPLMPPPNASPSKNFLAAGFRNMEPNSRDSCSDTDSGILTDNASDVADSGSCDRLPHESSNCNGSFKVLPSYPLCSAPDGLLRIKKSDTFPTATELCPRILSNAVVASTDSSRSSSPKTLKSDRERSPKRGKPLRVRFADEVASARSTDASPLRATPPPLPVKPESIPAHGTGKPERPPPYEAACERLRSLKLDDTSPTSAVSGGIPKRIYYYTTDEFYNSNYIRAKSNQLLSSFGGGGNNLRTGVCNTGTGLTGAKSMDNLANNPVSRYGTLPANFSKNRLHPNPCVMPSDSCDAIVSLGSEPLDIERNSKSLPHPGRGPRLVKRNAASTQGNGGRRRFASAERPRRVTPPIVGASLPASDLCQTPTGDGDIRDGYCADVRCRLVGLDCRGIQTVELEKVGNGPFGFFIACGSYKKKKGIFISRVSAQSLIPMLSVGDQLLEVDNTSTKGMTLEQVQALMANRLKISLKVFPALVR